MFGRTRKVPVVFDSRYAQGMPAVPFDPHRGENIATFLALHKLVKPADLVRPKPASLYELRSVHQDEYLESLTDARTLSRVVGAQVAEREVDAIFELQRLHVGGTRDALQLALDGHSTVFHLGGGLHHARPAGGHGFCLFNDIAVAISDARRRGYRGRIVVIDCDLHDGDGTRLCFADDASVHTWSIHNETLDHTPAIEATNIALGAGVEDATFARALNLPAFAADCVIYVAGCDPAFDDMIGNWKLSDKALLARDRAIIDYAAGRPTVVVLAGGYGPQAWRYSARFLGDFIRRGRTLEPPHTTEMTLARLHHLRRVLDPVHDPHALTEEDIFGDLGRAPRRFLGYYSLPALELVLERYGVFDRLRLLGFKEPTLAWTLGQPMGDTLRIFGAPGELVVEICLRRDRRTLPGFELLYLEWLLMQNPRAAPQRELLPGQQHPSLGLLSEAMGLLVMVCERLHLDGLVFVPTQYHLAKLGSRYMRFLDKKVEEAFRRGERAAWKPTPMVLPLTDALRNALA